MPGDAGGRRRSISVGKISALHRAFLSECVHSYPSRKDEGRRAQEVLEDARERAQAVTQKLREMRLKEAAKKVEDGIEETLTCYAFPSEHWLKIRTNNMLEHLNREIRRRTRVVGAFPDGESALMLVCARLRHVTGTQWGVSAI